MIDVSRHASRHRIKSSRTPIDIFSLVETEPESRCQDGEIEAAQPIILSVGRSTQWVSPRRQPQITTSSRDSGRRRPLYGYTDSDCGNDVTD